MWLCEHTHSRGKVNPNPPYQDLPPPIQVCFHLLEDHRLPDLITSKFRPIKKQWQVAKVAA